MKKTLYFISFCLFIIVLYLSFDFYKFNKKRNSFVIEKGTETSNNLRNQIDEILQKIVKEGDRLAEMFGGNSFSKNEVEEIIRKSALSIPEIQGVTACYEPNSFSEQSRLYCPYYNKGSQDFIFVEDSYDYTVSGKTGTAWYTGVRDNGAKWVEPYYAAAAKDWYIDYGIPFYYSNGINKGKVRGTITLSFICSGFKELVHSLSLGKTGYGMIVSEEGTFLSHPVNEFIGKTNLDTLIQTEEIETLKIAYEKLQNRETGYVNFNDKSNKKSIFFYDKIGVSNWGIGLMFYRNDILNDGKLLHRKYILISIFLSLFFISLIAIYYNKDYLDEGEIWRLSILTSTLLILNTFLVGYLEHNSRQIEFEFETEPITDIESLNSFYNQRVQRAKELKSPHPIAVPTGIYVQKMEFEDSYNLNVGGKLWQKFPAEYFDKIDIGFDFPQMSPFAEASFIEESYRKTIEAKEGSSAYVLVGYDFRVTLRLNLTYKNFPFDKRHISIEIVPKRNEDHLLFVPDLASYNYTSPSQKSGLNHKIEISGSKVIESYFNYSLETYDSDFGYGEKAIFEEVPVLHYNINLKRILLNAFVTYLIPIFVSLIMVFILIYACHKSQERQGIIESMAAFFFVLIFSHIDLRKEIITADLIYMEYFYFISYFMLIISTFNMIIYTKNKSAIFDFNDNQIFKALFFPMFFLILLVVTLVKFY